MSAENGHTRPALAAKRPEWEKPHTPDVGSSEIVTEEGEVVPAGIPGTMTPMGLRLPPGLPRKEWVRIGHILRAMEKGVQWWVGDWLAYGENSYGEEAFAELGRSDKTLANWASVARQIHPSRRVEGVRFSHHAEVAPLPPEEQSEVLREVKEGNLTVGQTRERREQKQRARAEAEGRECGSKPITVEIPECPTCGAPPDHWQRVPEGVRRGG